MVCPDTELAVLAAVAQLEYVPEDTARSLPQVGARSFGVAMPAISNVYFREVVDGTEGEAETAPRRWPKRDESETGGRPVQLLELHRPPRPGQGRMGVTLMSTALAVPPTA